VWFTPKQCVNFSVGFTVCYTRSEKSFEFLKYLILFLIKHLKIKVIWRKRFYLAKEVLHFRKLRKEIIVIDK
jgi:hypothetical protein